MQQQVRAESVYVDKNRDQHFVMQLFGLLCTLPKDIA